MKHITSAIRAVIERQCRMATVYVSENHIVRATARFKYSKHCSRHEILLTIGKPNFVERRFIRACKRAGEPLPVKKAQIKAWPKKK